MLYIRLVANGYVCYFHFRGGITMSDTTGNIIKKVLLLEKNTSPTCANYNTIKKVAGYIRGLSYLKHNDTKVRIKAYIANDFDYNETLLALKKKGIKTTYGALKASISYANKMILVLSVRRESERNRRIIKEALYLTKYIDGSVIITPCNVNMRTKEVINIVPCFYDCNSTMDGEFVLINEQEYPVIQAGDREPFDDNFWYE